MKIIISTFLILLIIINVNAQPDRIKNIFPAGTTFHQNIPYAGDTIKKHLLDIYLPANAAAKTPLIIWIHGGAWNHGDKYADMSYMKNTIRALIENGYAIASIDYRQSTTAVFPAQIRDCNQAIEFIHNNAANYKLDRDRFVIMGFSAGGHLGSLLSLSLNNNITDFYPESKKPSFKIRAVLDFYGPSDFMLFYGTAVPGKPEDDSIAKLLGASPLLRPDLAKWASPVTYVDKNDPPFFIVNGEKDESVPTAQSYLLKSYLDLAQVKNQITIVKDAPHYGEMFDQDVVKLNLLKFIKDH
jgi:acetyl esterase/lipase